MHALQYSAKGKLLLAAFIFPFAIALGIANKKRLKALRVPVGLFSLALVLGSLSCGGGSSGGSGGGNGSNNYTVTVTASVAGTNTTRTLGTIEVTVTY
jgi:hypothetical protein